MEFRNLKSPPCCRSLPYLKRAGSLPSILMVFILLKSLSNLLQLAPNINQIVNDLPPFLILAFTLTLAIKAHSAGYPFPIITTIQPWVCTTWLQETDTIAAFDERARASKRMKKRLFSTSPTPTTNPLRTWTQSHHLRQAQNQTHAQTQTQVQTQDKVQIRKVNSYDKGSITMRRRGRPNQDEVTGLMRLLKERLSIGKGKLLPLVIYAWFVSVANSCCLGSVRRSKLIQIKLFLSAKQRCSKHILNGGSELLESRKRVLYIVIGNVLVWHTSIWQVIGWTMAQSLM